jgi:hypothetical protein
MQGFCRSEDRGGRGGSVEEASAGQVQRAAANKFDGIDMHEAMNFESARGMELLKRMRDQLDGKQLASRRRTSR